MSKSTFERMVWRANRNGSTSGERIIAAAEKSFRQALVESTEAETVSVGENEFRALVIMSKAFGDGADKRILCVPNQNHLTTGELVYIPSTGRRWLTFNPELRNKAYKRFMVKEVNEDITWRSRDNEVFQTGAVVGTLTGENTLSSANGYGYWQNSERVYCYIPKVESTKHIEVDRNIVMNDETWKVLAVNTIQEEGVLAIQLTKWKNDDMINKIPEVQIIGKNEIRTAFGLVYSYKIVGLTSEISEYNIYGLNMSYVVNESVLEATFEDGQLGIAKVICEKDGQIVAELTIELLPPY